MKNFYFILLLSSFLHAKEHIILPLSKTLPEIKTIDEYAITVPGGKNTIYVFVDPFCHYSQDFVEVATDKNNKLRKTYTYKIFLLKLNKFKSMKTIRKILDSKDRLKALTNFMIKHKNLDTNSTISNIEVDTIISEVQKVGKKLDIYKRPYLIIEYEGWEEDEDDFGDFDDDEEEE